MYLDSLYLIDKPNSDIDSTDGNLNFVRFSIINNLYNIHSISELTVIYIYIIQSVSKNINVVKRLKDRIFLPILSVENVFFWGVICDSFIKK